MASETPPEILSRLPDVGTSIFTVMSKMALEHNAINLSQGFPDFPVDEKLIHLIHQCMLAGHNQYAPMPGLPALLRTIAEVLETTHSRVFNPDTEIIVTSGATEGLYACITAFITPGDEVILFDPSYDSYDPAIRLNGGVPVRLNLFPSDFSIPWETVEKSITSKTRMLIVNTPHNPTGSVLSADDLQHLERLALKYGLLVLSDEVYERIIFDGIKHQSVLSRPGLASQSIAVFSFGKTFHATGWKVGYSVAPEHLTREIRKTHQFITFSVNTPIQMALAEYMKNPEHFIHLGSFFGEKRDFFRNQMEGSSFELLPSRGSYFQLMSYRNISSKNEVEMAEELTRKFKVAAIPVSVFYKDRTDNKLLRFCFAKREETLSRAGEILRKL
jgi:methionine aminotransferase